MGEAAWLDANEIKKKAHRGNNCSKSLRAQLVRETGYFHALAVSS